MKLSLTRTRRTSLDIIICFVYNAKCNFEINRYNEGGFASYSLDKTAKKLLDKTFIQKMTTTTFFGFQASRITT